ncbi:MAG TPA: GNAT family protein [Candidatus Limnocylindrales bacterium]|nr:GNAT family protein [Candidatus Limnocylindrales bacterium]
MSARWGLIQDQPDVVGAWVCERTGGAWHKGCGTALGFTFDGALKAGAIYTSYTGADVQLGFAVEDRRVFNRASIWFAFYYPFQQLGCRRITARVNCDNVRSLALVEHLGFVREATLTDAAPNGDQIQFRMLKSECRWLRDNRYKPRAKAA